ncbi:MAG: hypothetical protein H0X52_09260 [Gemmatimonadetes bacterium]|nr:hypothetical protein [Gemmatimonadota bacterium]
MSSGGRLALPPTRAWELVPTFRPQQLKAGARWSDPIRLVAEENGFRQALTGTRVSTLVRDTTVAGRRFWIVRDSARARYQERWIDDERTLDTLATVERTVDGVLRARHLYDPELRLFRLRHDTTALSGTAVLSYPDGRSFPTPAHYERTRRWELFDSTGYAARRARRDSVFYANVGGMLYLPRDQIEQRLSRGDTVLRNSLVARWHQSRDPEQRFRLMELIERWGRGGPQLEMRLHRLALEAGDTAHALREILHRWSWNHRPPVTAAELEHLLPFMDAPGLAFAFGLDRDPFYEYPRGGLLSRIPALLPDSTQWPCTPDACRLLAAQRETAREPRLRDLGLIASLALEPARWADAVLQRAQAGSATMGPAIQLIEGVGATWPAASKAPLPRPDADWRAWLEWMNGRDPRYPRDSNAPAGTAVRFEQSHAQAIRFYQVRTGRPVIQELQRELTEATGDSARLVYTTILLGLGERSSDPAQVAQRLRFGSPAERALAVRELSSLFRNAEVPDSATNAALIDRILGIAIEAEAPWPDLHPPDAERKGLGHLRRINERSSPVFILADNLPAPVRRKWQTRAQLITSEQWNARSDRLPGILFRPGRVLRAGPFVYLDLDYSTRAARREDQAPAGSAGGFTVYLLETEKGWMLVSASEWIT